MDAVVDSLLTTLSHLTKKRSAIDEQSRDLLRLCQRCDIFLSVLTELKSHPAMLNDLTEAENELLYDLHTTVQNICTFIDDNIHPSDVKAITQLDFRLSYFTDLAQLNQRILQLIEALNLIEQIDLDRSREEDLEDAKESFEYIVNTVLQEIAKPNNVYFEEELDTLIQDVESHEEALSKLLSLLKHRPLSVNEVKVLKAETAKLRQTVESQRLEIKNNRNSKSSSRSGGRNNNNQALVPYDDPMGVGSATSSRPNSGSSAASSLTSPSVLAALGVRSLPPTPGNDNMIPFRGTNNYYGRPDSPASNNSGESYHNNNHSGTSAVSSSSASSSLSIDFNAQLLNRLLKPQEALSQEDLINKKKILDSLTIQPKDVETTKIRVGRGVFGDVCLGTLRNRYKISIKTLKRSNDQRKDEHRRRLIEKEMLITKYLGSYPTIPTCYGFVTNDSFIQVIMELAPYGSLSLLLHDSNSFPIIPVGVKIAWLSDLADAIRFLHSKEIMHKNICCDHLLVFEKLRIKLGDFGPEKSTSSSKTGLNARTEGDMKAFTAPEVREGKNPEYGSDIYSFAITSIQIFSRRLPHLERPHEQVQSAIEKEWIEPPESKDSLLTLLNNCLTYDPNEHVNDSRPTSEDVFQDMLSILETVGGDPREEMSSNDFFVIKELETTARQKRNETLRHKSNYKSNLALRNNANYNNLNQRSGNLTTSSLLMRSSFRGNPVNPTSPNHGNNNHPNMSTFSYSHLKMVPDNISLSGGNDFNAQSLDMEDKASIAYFLIQAAGFTSLEADFMADRLVRKGVSCVSTLRRKLHRDGNYLASIGVDKETAKRISTAIFNLKQKEQQQQPSQNHYSGSNSSSASTRPRGQPQQATSLYQRSLMNSNSSSATARSFHNGLKAMNNSSANNLSMFERDGDGQTDREYNNNDESDSNWESANEFGNGNNRRKDARYSVSMKQQQNNSTEYSGSNHSSKKATKEINLEKGLTAPSVDLEEEIVADGYSNKEREQRRSVVIGHESRNAKELLNATKSMMEKRNYLSKFLRVEINLSPDLANKYSDILISREIYDLPTLHQQLLNDHNLLIRYGFDKRISTAIVKHITEDVVDRFEEENHKTNDLDMSMTAHTIVNNVSALHSPASFIRTNSNSSLLREYVNNNCSDHNPLDIANLYYEASQLSNADSLEKLLEIADNGDYLAQGFLMRMYGLGQGEVKQDIIVAKEMGTKLFPWLQHAIQTDNSAQVVMLARYLTGVCFSLGLGVAQNDGEAIKWYLQSAHQGYIGAQAYLGYCYYLGVGVQKDLTEAFNWYKISAVRGHSASQCNLGLCFEYGHGSEKNLQEAIRWYRASAEQGDVIAQFSLGSIYEKGKQGNKEGPNFREAFRYYKLSADKGYDQAQYSLGCCYYAGLGTEQNAEEAFRYFSLAAHNGNASGQCKLGFCYENGHGTEKNPFKAVEYYRFAAEQGNASAMYYLGYCYFTGMGVDVANVKEAVKLYTLAAQKKYPAAQNNLGFCYFNGIGVPKDLSLAVKWYEQAAKQDYAAAQYNLGYCYEKGIGVEVDLKQCQGWYERASKNGHSRAKKSLKRLL